MPKLSIAEAARIAGTQRSTLYRAMANGKLSYEILIGRKVIDPSELARVYPPERPKVVRTPARTSPKAQPEPDAPDTEERVVLAVLQKELQLMREQNRALEQDKQDLRVRLDRAEQDRGVALRLLEDQRLPRAEKKKASKKGRKR